MGAASNYDTRLTVFELDGTLLFQKSLSTPGDERLAGVARDPRGAFIVAGHTGGSLFTINAGGEDFLLVKYNSQGIEVFELQEGTSGDERWRSVATDRAGNIFVTGNIEVGMSGYSVVGGSDALVRKYTSSGELVWTRGFGSGGHDYGWRVAVDGAGDILVLGTFQGTISGVTTFGEADVIVRKYSSDGETLWSRSFGTTAAETARTLALDGEGNAYVGGSTRGEFTGATLSGASDAYVAKVTHAGELAWVKQFGSALNDTARGIAIDERGTVYVSGSLGGEYAGGAGNGGSDAFLYVISANGKLGELRRFGTASDELEVIMSVDSQGALLLFGETQGVFPEQSNSGSSDVFLIRLRP